MPWNSSSSSKLTKKKNKLNIEAVFPCGHFSGSRRFKGV